MEKKLLPGSEPYLFDGNKYGLIMLHGFTSSPCEMKPLANFLKSKGYSINIPLLCGHGTSVKDLAKCNWYDWFQDAKKALFELRKKCEKIVVIGLSTGGSLALHLAAHYQIEGIVALAPGLYLREKKVTLLPYVAPFIKYINKKNGPDIRDEQAKAKAVTYKKTPVKGAIEVVKLYNHLKMDLPEVYAPLFIAHSENDHVVDFKSSEEIYDTVSSKDKRFLKLKKSYHILTLDVEKDILYREIQNFVESIFKGEQKQSNPA